MMNGIVTIVFRSQSYTRTEIELPAEIKIENGQSGVQFTVATVCLPEKKGRDYDALTMIFHDPDYVSIPQNPIEIKHRRTESVHENAVDELIGKFRAEYNTKQ